MTSKTCIITGGNAGIGKEIAVSLARMNHQVVIVSRDKNRGEKALADIIKSSSNNSAKLVIGNLDTIRSVKTLAEEIIIKFPGVSILINNAGVWPMEKRINEDGLEYSFMVNHIAPLILSTMLLPQLKKNSPARIVNVSAGLYVNGAVDLDKTPFGSDFSSLKTYMNTKLCNVFFTRKFSKMIEGSGVTINAVHPGVIRTNLGVAKGITGWLLRAVKIFFASPREGAKAPVWLATSEELQKVNGKYFDLMVEKPYTANALNDYLMEKLYQFSMKKAQL
jgi:NAD(P)-dependent dehydrogenase (short-subunit alcohol dehydrogenase family)